MAAWIAYGPLAPRWQPIVEDVTRLGDALAIPLRTILIFEQDELVVDEPRRSARVVEEHEREQRLRFGLGRQEIDEHPSSEWPHHKGRRARARRRSLVNILR